LQPVGWEEDTRWSYVLSAEIQRVMAPEGVNAAGQKLWEGTRLEMKIETFH